MSASAGLVYLAVGIRLIQLSRRTNRSPEWILGLTFVLWSANYLVYDIPYLFLEEAAAVPFYFVARLALDLGIFLFVMFIWKVFRSEDRWGGWLVAGIGACLVAGIAGSIWIGDWEGMLPISNPWFWPAWLAGSDRVRLDDRGGVPPPPQDLASANAWVCATP